VAEAQERVRVSAESALSYAHIAAVSRARAVAVLVQALAGAAEDAPVRVAHAAAHAALRLAEVHRDAARAVRDAAVSSAAKAAGDAARAHVRASAAEAAVAAGYDAEELEVALGQATARARRLAHAAMLQRADDDDDAAATAGADACVEQLTAAEDAAVAARARCVDITGTPQLDGTVNARRAANWNAGHGGRATKRRAGERAVRLAAAQWRWGVPIVGLERGYCVYTAKRFDICRCPESRCGSAVCAVSHTERRRCECGGPNCGHRLCVHTDMAHELCICRRFRWVRRRQADRALASGVRAWRAKRARAAGGRTAHLCRPRRG
jgi:hypothetical protein